MPICIAILKRFQSPCLGTAGKLLLPQAWEWGVELRSSGIIALLVIFAIPYHHPLVVWSLSHVQLFCDSKDSSLPALLSMGFSRQEYWSGLPFPSPGDLLGSGLEPASPALQVKSFPLSHPGSFILVINPILPWGCSSVRSFHLPPKLLEEFRDEVFFFFPPLY